MMTPQQFLDHCIKFAKRAFKKYGGMDNMFIVVMPDESHTPFMLPWQGEAHKQLMCAVLRDQFREQGVVMYANICEAWFYATPPGTKVADLTVRASKHPDRRECLQVMVAHQDGTKLSEIFVIDRSGPRPKLRPLPDDFPKPDQHGGRMMELLDDPDAETFFRPGAGKREH